MMTNQYVCMQFESGDPTRMGAQVISGIGFLGAGAILVTKDNQIKGLTTAAGLWTVTGIGLAIGIGSVSYTHLDVYKRQVEFGTQYNRRK